MKYPVYPAYQSTGIEWLGNVPVHWGVGRISALFRLRSGGTPSTDIADYWGGDIPWVSAKDMKTLRIVDTEDHITSTAVRESATSIVPVGTVLIVARSGILKHTLPVAVAARPVAINQDIKGLLPSSERINGLFFSYWIQGNQLPLLTLWRQQGATVESLELEKVKTTGIPLPPIGEQIAIVGFLDRETAKLDTLVEKKRALIERLKERRAALISRTVTRGLPPDAAHAAGLNPHPKLKPSGVEWFSEVPAHWEVSAIKHLVSTPVTDGPHETPEIFDEGIPFVSAEAINNGRINFEKIRGHISEDDHRLYSKKYKPQLGDIYMVKSGATTGRIAIVETDKEFNIWSPLAAIRCNAKLIDSRFVYLYLHSKEFQTAVELSWSFGTQQNIGMGVIQNLAVPVPPIDEQVVITKYLNCETTKIDRMVEKVEAAIERLREYRTALITAAVTGKIDVRGVRADNINITSGPTPSSHG